MFISNLRISLLSSSYLFNLFLKPLFENKHEQNFIFLTNHFLCHCIIAYFCLRHTSFPARLRFSAFLRALKKNPPQRVPVLGPILLPSARPASSH